MKRTCTVEAINRRKHEKHKGTPTHSRSIDIAHPWKAEITSVHFALFCTSVLTGINPCHISHRKVKDCFVHIRYQK